MNKKLLLGIVFALLVSAPAAFALEGDATGDGTDAGGDPTATVGSDPANSEAGADANTTETGGSGDEAVSEPGQTGSTQTTPTSGSATGGTSASNGSGTPSKGTGFVALAPIPGLTEGVTADQEGLANFFNNLYKYLIGLAAALAVIMIIWGGLQYATQDVPGAKNEGKERIQQAILGLILILAPVLVFSIINPAILNLSVNLPPLDTKSGPAPTQKTTNQCADPNLTPAQQQACQTAQNAYQTGLVGMDRNQQEAAKQAVTAVKQTADEQKKACSDGGGRVYSAVVGVQNGKCSPSACLEAARNNYTTCDVLIDGSVCISNTGTACPDPRKK